MASTKPPRDVMFVSEVSVEGDISVKSIVAILEKLSLGTHQTISEVLREKADNCFIVGKIVAIKNSNPCNDVQKLIIREVTLEGCSERNVALFILGEVVKSLKKFPVEVDDLLVIHKPDISKSCLRRFPGIQSHACKLQIIVNYSLERKDIPASGPFLQLIKSKVPDVVEGGAEQHPKDSAVDKNSPLRAEDDIKTQETDNGDSPRPKKKIRRLMNCEDYLQLKVPPNLATESQRHHYTRLGKITPSCTKVNIMAVITSVEKGCQSLNNKEHLLIYLQDESSFGKNFLLNLASCTTEIPPLHDNYIMRALNVLILYENDDITGWANSGKLLATFDSDCEKPIAELTVEENCSVSELDKDRIMELRMFVKSYLSISQNEECHEIPLSEHCSQEVILDSDSVGSADQESMRLRLESTSEELYLEIASISLEVPDVVEGGAEQHPKDSAVDKNSPLRAEDDIKTQETDNGDSPRPKKKIRRLMNCEPEDLHYPPGQRLTMDRSEEEERSPFSNPDVGSDADAMVTLWNFVMEY